jgi:hypothetical protein
MKDASPKKINSISEATSICFKENIKIVREIVGKSQFRIVIDYNGRKKVGQELYHVDGDQKKLNKKILELYVSIANNIQNRK